MDQHVIILSMSVFITVDIGGTQIRTAAYSHNRITPIQRNQTETISGDEPVFDRLTRLIDSIWPAEKVDAISVASAGPIDPKSGTIIDATNIPGWKDFPISTKLTARYNIPAFLGNDANLAALGEWKYGAGRGHNHLLYITISTGIGGGGDMRWSFA